MSVAPPPRLADASLAYLFGRLRILEARVRAAVERRRAVDPDPNDRFRGLYISDAQVDELLNGAGPGAADAAGPAGDERSDRALDVGAAEAGDALAALDRGADAAVMEGTQIRLRSLAGAFGLTTDEVEILLVAMAPDLDPRFERLYAYLQDDVSRRRASTGLALELCGATDGVREARARLVPSAPLIAGDLLRIEETERPFLTRSLRVEDRITAHLLGDDTPDPRVHAILSAVMAATSGPSEALQRTRDLGARLWYIRERPGAAGTPMAMAALSGLGLRHLTVDLARLGRDDDAVDAVAAAIREARLAGATVVAGPIETLSDKVAAIRLLAEAACPTVLVGARQWDPAWTPEVPVLLTAPVPSATERSAMWRATLDGHAPATIDAAGQTTPFRLTPEQVRRAARAAEFEAAAEGRPIETTHLLAGARAQNAAGLERLARRIEPRVRWDDLVLPPDTIRQLSELTARARHRDRVLDDWGMAARASKGRGLTALFAGDSGTGKTMSAEMVAADLGLDLYVIDLSTVVDKYIGETEKNLDRIFAEADRVNAVLLFDEADAIFGKRSEVKDARDRYANVEIAYLLQRMEQFDGLAILTTNLRANVDEAFLRRLDVIADFPTPEEEDRLRLWELHLAPQLPRADDIDLDFLAGAFKLSGGNIRNICLAAAFLAASEDRPVGMTDLVRATEREYQKLGRMIHVSEFGPYFELLRASA